MADRRRRHSSYKIAKRRAEAITFLSNISLSGKVEKKHRKNGEGSKQNVTVVDDDTKDDVGFKVRPNVNIANVRDSTTTPSRVSIPNVLTLETPQEHEGRLERHTPPSSPTKGSGDRFFVSRSFSSEPRHHLAKQIPSEPYLSVSNHSSNEELQHVITIRKLSSLESPPEGAEMDFSRQRFTRGFCSGGRVVLVSSHKVPFAIWSHLRYKRTSQYAHMRLVSVIS
ncbi:hypothetical protein BSL78_15012 [Apostichopus japonicus]|uniref:Uncharacterized protein n=1 Tax=Stichopus japonicus TaxID=307972 RepID=A0A2G8KJF4_STIJA|nr:hypothetical protein BSL78_15012 [Apostichopus japonicus]